MTSRAIKPNRWDSKVNRVKGRKPDARLINGHLEQMKQDVYAALKELKIEGKEVTAEEELFLYILTELSVNSETVPLPLSTIDLKAIFSSDSN